MGSQDSIVVVGGGISGLTAAVEAAEVGYDVTLIEKEPFQGEQTSFLFPKTLRSGLRAGDQLSADQDESQDQVHHPGRCDRYHRRTWRLRGETVNVAPRMVNDNCTACNKCVEACPMERPNERNFGMDTTKAIYIDGKMAFPQKYVIDAAICDKCGKCVEACAYNAIDLEMAEETLTIKAGAIIQATGWNPYDANNLDNLAFGKAANVVTNVMMERIAAVDGPNQGKILRPSDGAAPKSVAFVQCAGSRDQNHLPYCSGVCCTASLKQIRYVKEQYPDAKVTMYYIDRRALGYLEDFMAAAEALDGVSLVKGKVAKITEVDNGNLKLEVEDIAAGTKINPEMEMVVLATGLVPTRLPGDIKYDDYGFVTPDNVGIFGAGCAKRPTDVSSSVMDATGATIKAIQTIVAGGA